MTIEETSLKDVFIISPRVFIDGRGYFFESFNLSAIKGTVLNNYNWVQENESKSTKGVLRGLHFQKGNHSQAKLVRVIIGEVFDVAVDLRKNSPTFGKSYSVVLSDKNKKQLLIPRGFAHGFLVLSDTAVFSYKCDNYYSPKHDSGVIYNDLDLKIDWPELDIHYQLSKKDESLDDFKDVYKF